VFKRSRRVHIHTHTHTAAQHSAKCEDSTLYNYDTETPTGSGEEADPDFSHLSLTEKERGEVGSRKRRYGGEARFCMCVAARFFISVEIFNSTLEWFIRPIKKKREGASAFPLLKCTRRTRERKVGLMPSRNR
jgi:hypothetical protein